MSEMEHVAWLFLVVAWLMMLAVLGFFAADVVREIRSPGSWRVVTGFPWADTTIGLVLLGVAGALMVYTAILVRCSLH